LITYVKVQKISNETAETKASMAEKDNVDQDRSLTVKGATENGEVLFQYNH